MSARCQVFCWILVSWSLGAVNGCEKPRFDRKQRATITSLRLSARLTPPPSPSNRVADNPDAVTLGRALFFSKALSGDGSLSCASCHRPELFYVDGLPRSKGVKETLRNAPTVVGSAFHTWFYWDGRRDSLWSQALIPIESADEMGGNRVDAIRVVKRSPELSRAYRAAFGESPPSLEGLPGANPFGTAEQKRAWAGLGAQVQERVNRVFSNLGKSLASFQRTLRPTPGAFDAYVTSLERGQRSDYSDEARHGLELFIDDEKTRCLRCHNGPLFTNYDFHNIGTGNFDGERLDFGRVFGVRALKLDP
ncbi:MAG: cytochrome c peroxidase, partial [Myxococcota bacterium]